MFDEDDFARIAITGADLRRVSRKRLIGPVVLAAISALLLVAGCVLVSRANGAGDLRLLNTGITTLKFAVAASAVTAIAVVFLVIDLKILKASRRE
ncbi:MAG: hypothetical protein JWO97_2125 [Acidobacteria bacterium]|nr:hypothetical protein [Acidobacteriota bacterium]